MVSIQNPRVHINPRCGSLPVVPSLEAKTAIRDHQSKLTLENTHMGMFGID